VDVAQIAELRKWASRLEERSESNDELRAAAKAIRMLVDEVESLQAKVVSAQTGTPLPLAPQPEESPAAANPAWEAADDRLSGSFLSRLKRTLGFE
jgi:hypothetical protein